jgi:hypothetical protein
MKKFTLEILVLFGFFLIGIAGFIQCLNMISETSKSPLGNSATFPIILFIFLIIISVLLIVTSLREKKKSAEICIYKENIGRILVLILASTAYLFGTSVISYIPRTIILLGITLWLFGLRRRGLFIVIMFVTPFILHGIFVIIFKIQIP